MKIGIIGCGMISDTHVKQIQKLQGTEIVAVCDIEKMMAEQLADRYKIPGVYSDAKKMIIECAPDVVHVLTPPTTHQSLCSLAIENGCHVLVEKPFTRSYTEALTVIEKAKAAKKKITVNHFHNFAPPATRIKNLISSGKIGRIVHMESFYSYNMESQPARTLLGEKGSWLYSLPGTILHNNISHLIYKLLNFMPAGNLKAQAMAFSYHSGINSDDHIKVDDELRVILTNGNCTAYATFSSNIEPFTHCLKIYGTKQTLLADYETRAVICYSNNSLPGPFGKLTSPIQLSKKYLFEGIRNVSKFIGFDFHYYAGMENLLKLFYSCIQNKTAPPIPYNELLRNTLLIEDIFSQIYSIN